MNNIAHEIVGINKISAITYRVAVRENNAISEAGF
jgi:hypothetical protein